MRACRRFLGRRHRGKLHRMNALGSSKLPALPSSAPSMFMHRVSDMLEIVVDSFPDWRKGMRKDKIFRGSEETVLWLLGLVNDIHYIKVVIRASVLELSISARQVQFAWKQHRTWRMCTQVDKPYFTILLPSFLARFRLHDSRWRFDFYGNWLKEIE